MTTEGNAQDLLSAWGISLRAQRRSSETVRSYVTGVRLYYRHSDTLTLRGAQSFLVSLVEQGQTPATVHTRWWALKAFSRWLVEEGELASDPLLRLKRPVLETPVVSPYKPAQVAALLKAARGPLMIDRRDEALLWLLSDTGMRIGEALALTVDAVNLGECLAVVAPGKTRKGRLVPFSPRCSEALRRYLRAREEVSQGPWLFVTERGKQLRYQGAYDRLQRLADRAQVPGVRAHRFRHTFACDWLAAGGSELGLRSLAGWSDTSGMVARYAASGRQARAIEEARNLAK